VRKIGRERERERGSHGRDHKRDGGMKIIGWRDERKNKY